VRGPLSFWAPYCARNIYITYIRVYGGENAAATSLSERHSGARVSANPESRLDGYDRGAGWIPGSVLRTAPE
jgi:hypothetical protein